VSELGGKKSLSGSKHGYAAYILYHVCKELDYPQRLFLFLRADENLKEQSISKAKNNLKKVFKSWFDSYIKPEKLMPKYCQELGLNNDQTRQAQVIVNKIHSGGDLQSCQPLTTVGVALYVLNARSQFTDDHKIASAVNKRLQTIRDNFEKKIKQNMVHYLPDELL